MSKMVQSHPPLGSLHGYHVSATGDMPMLVQKAYTISIPS